MLFLGEGQRVAVELAFDDGDVADGVPFRDIATVIGEQLGVPAVSITAEEALEQLGFIGAIAALDNPPSSARTRELLGWRPEQPTLLADLKAGHYFAPAS